MNQQKRVNKLARKDFILTEAGKLFSELGYEKASIRKIASKINYSPASIYIYFQDKEDIFSALLDQGIDKLKMEFRDLVTSADPLDQLSRMLNCYLRFALNNPQMYRLLYSDANLRPEFREKTQFFYQSLRKVIAEGIKVNAINRKDVESTSFTVWSMVHGMAMLSINGQMEENEMDLNSLHKKTLINISAFLKRDNLF